VKLGKVSTFEDKGTFDHTGDVCGGLLLAYQVEGLGFRQVTTIMVK
jgi:hypothetical protein